jgi:hypothetical protein
VWNWLQVRVPGGSSPDDAQARSQLSMACRAHSSFEYYGQQMEAGEIAAVGRLERHRLSNRTVMARQTADGTIGAVGRGG